MFDKPSVVFTLSSAAEAPEGGRRDFARTPTFGGLGTERGGRRPAGGRGWEWWVPLCSQTEY